jgi:Trk-type K+ transport system membrane component
MLDIAMLDFGRLGVIFLIVLLSPKFVQNQEFEKQS